MFDFLKNRGRIDELEKIAREPIPRGLSSLAWLEQAEIRSDAADQVRKIREAEFQAKISADVAQLDADEKRLFRSVGIDTRWVDWLNGDRR